jgi:hypothetical protein
MLTVRITQKRELETAAKDRFVRELVEHFRVHLPAHHEALGPEGTREAVLDGIVQAQGHGIVTEPGVTAYVRLMFLFGRGYDSDPALPWAGAILRDATIPDEPTRVGRLVSAAIAHLQARAEEQAP